MGTQPPRTSDRNPYFSKRLKELRKKHKMSQSELAKKLGIEGRFGIATISGWERKQREPSLNTLVKIANCFGVTTDYLLGRDMGIAEFYDEQLVIKNPPLNEKEKRKLVRLIKAFLEEED